jgi:hypothetical protein
MAWHWEKVGASLMAKPVEWVGVLNTRMKALEGHLGVIATTFTVSDRAETTDATVTTVKAVAIPPSTTLLVSGYVVARRTGGSAGTAHDGAAYRVEFVAKNDAGTTALIAAATVTVIGESQAAFAVTATASSGNVLVQVAGAANNNITWVWVGHSVGVDDRS